MLCPLLLLGVFSCMGYVRGRSCLLVFGFGGEPVWCGNVWRMC